MKRILVVDDEHKKVRLLCNVFRATGFKVLTCLNPEAAAGQVAMEQPDLIVLDVVFPGALDGYEVCRKIREFSSVPLILLTARVRDADKLSGFDAGADDYVTKPFNFEELLARIKANIRKNAPAALNTHLVFKDIEIDLDSFNVKRQSQEITLSRTEFDLFYYLVLNHDLVQSREQILDKVWGFDYDGGDNIVDVYIKYLRDKIDRDFAEKLIQTVRGRGYVVR